MQMYRVQFARTLPGGMADCGDVLVCGQSAAHAKMIVNEHYKFVGSEVEFAVQRVKPSIYEIERRNKQGVISTVVGTLVPASAACRATFPRQERYWYRVVASALLRGSGESDAIAMLGRAIHREMSGDPQKRSCMDLAIECRREEPQQQPTRTEKQAIYTEKRFFSGGAARPR